MASPPPIALDKTRAPPPDDGGGGGDGSDGDNDGEEEPGWKRLHGANLSRRRARLDKASRARPCRLAGECRSRLVEAVRWISGGCSQRKVELGLLLSGGVDSRAILEACSLAGAPLSRSVTVSIVDDPDQIPEDERCATEAVAAHNERNSNGNNGGSQSRLAHTIVRMSPAQLVRDHSEPVIRTLAVWGGGMETRNSLVMSAGFAVCRELGLKDVLLGDNVDELLGGSCDWCFRQRYEDHLDEWIAKRNASAATSRIARQPFRIKPLLVEWATESTTRTDCIDVHGSCLLRESWGGPSTNKHNCGKLPLTGFEKVLVKRKLERTMAAATTVAAVQEAESQSEEPI